MRQKIWSRNPKTANTGSTYSQKRKKGTFSSSSSMMLKNLQRHLRNQTTRNGGKANPQMSLSSQRSPKKSKMLSIRTFPSHRVTIHQRARSGITSSQSALSQFGQLPKLQSSAPVEAASLFSRFRLLADPDLRPPAIAPHCWWWWCVCYPREVSSRDRFERGSTAALLSCCCATLDSAADNNMS